MTRAGAEKTPLSCSKCVRFVFAVRASRGAASRGTRATVHLRREDIVAARHRPDASITVSLIFFAIGSTALLAYRAFDASRAQRRMSEQMLRELGSPFNFLLDNAVRYLKPLGYMWMRTIAGAGRWFGRSSSDGIRHAGTCRCVTTRLTGFEHASYMVAVGADLPLA